MADLEAVHGNKDGITDIGKQDKKKRYIELRARGYSYAKIAKELGVSKSTLSNWSQEMEGQVASLKAIELESLQEEYFMLKEGRIKLLGEMVSRLREEALSRDLAEVPTEKLLEMLLKYHSELMEEAVDVRPLTDREQAVLRDRSGTNLNSKQIEAEMAVLLLRYKAGLLDTAQAKQELSVLKAMLKAREQAEMEGKLEALEAVVVGRR